MSNTATKAGMYQFLNYCSMLDLFEVEKTQIPEVEEEPADVPSYQSIADEVILPDIPQVMQTLLPINPTVLRI